eukprot:6151801-Pyramimonas_sp.AAC.1
MEGAGGNTCRAASGGSRRGAGYSPGPRQRCIRSSRPRNHGTDHSPAEGDRPRRGRQRGRLAGKG